VRPQTPRERSPRSRGSRTTSRWPLERSGISRSSSETGASRAFSRLLSPDRPSLSLALAWGVATAALSAPGRRRPGACRHGRCSRSASREGRLPPALGPRARRRPASRPRRHERRIALLDLAGRSLGSIALPDPEPGRGSGSVSAAPTRSSSPRRRAPRGRAQSQGAQVREFRVWPGGRAGRRDPRVARHLFRADTGNHNVRALSLDGREQAVWGGLGEGRAQFRGPFRLAQDSLDRVLVSDALNSRVLAFTPRVIPSP